MKDWKTTLCGAIFAFSMLLYQQGVRIGHIGATDGLGLIQVVAAAILGKAAADGNQSK